MNGPRLEVALLDAAHDGRAFDCGTEPLNRYLHEQVGQDTRRRVAACFVALEGDRRIAGYYTRASASVRLNELAASLAKKCLAIPRCLRSGWDDWRWMPVPKGRAWVSQCSLMPCCVPHALKSSAMPWSWMRRTRMRLLYRHHGFIALPDSPLTLFVPLASVQKISS